MRQLPTRKLPVRKLPLKLVAERYSVHTRTIERWLRNVPMGFPRPLVINRRYYFDEDELDAYDAKQRRTDDIVMQTYREVYGGEAP
jgi:hypothetical protein